MFQPHSLRVSKFAAWHASPSLGPGHAKIVEPHPPLAVAGSAAGDQSESQPFVGLLNGGMEKRVVLSVGGRSDLKVGVVPADQNPDRTGGFVRRPVLDRGSAGITFFPRFADE